MPHDIAILWIYGQKLSEFNLQHPLTCDGAMLPLSLYSFPAEPVDEVKVTLNTLGFAASKSVEFQFFIVGISIGFRHGLPFHEADLVLGFLSGYLSMDMVSIHFQSGRMCTWVQNSYSISGSKEGSSARTSD